MVVQIPSLQLHHGNTGQIPLLGFGTWQATGDDGYRAVRTALDLGYRHIDTAHIYGNESDVGRALADSGVDREDVFITSKIPPGRAGGARSVLDQSLRDLRVDYLDLWLIHWTEGSAHLPLWAHLLKAQEHGRVRAVGVSNYQTDQIDQLIRESGHAPAVNQIKWGPPLFDGVRATELAERQIVLEGYSAFKVTDLRDRRLADIAAAHGKSVAQVVLRWHIQHDVVVIPKSVNPGRIAENLDVFDFQLSDHDMAAIDSVGQ